MSLFSMGQTGVREDDTKLPSSRLRELHH